MSAPARWRRNDELETRNAALESGLRELKNGRCALEERHLALEKMLESAARSQSARLASETHLTRQAYSAAGIVARNEELETLVAGLRVTLATAEEQQEGHREELASVRADIQQHEDRAKHAERGLALERQRSAEASARAAAHAKRLARLLPTASSRCW